MSNIDPRPSFLSKPELVSDNPDSKYELLNSVGDCIICGSPNVVGFGRFSPKPEKRSDFAPEGTNPMDVGSIYYGLCQECVNLPDEDIYMEAEKKLLHDARETRGETL